MAVLCEQLLGFVATIGKTVCTCSAQAQVQFFPRYLPFSVGQVPRVCWILLPPLDPKLVEGRGCSYPFLTY